jgi:hypothetical protein
MKVGLPGDHFDIVFDNKERPFADELQLFPTIVSQLRYTLPRYACSRALLRTVYVTSSMGAHLCLPVMKADEDGLSRWKQGATISPEK